MLHACLLETSRVARFFASHAMLVSPRTSRSRRPSGHIPPPSIWGANYVCQLSVTSAIGHRHMYVRHHGTSVVPVKTNQIISVQLRSDDTPDKQTPHSDVTEDRDLVRAWRLDPGPGISLWAAPRERRCRRGSTARAHHLPRRGCLARPPLGGSLSPPGAQRDSRLSRPPLLA